MKYCPYCGKEVEDLDLHMARKHAREDYKELFGIRSSVTKVPGGKLNGV